MFLPKPKLPHGYSSDASPYCFLQIGKNVLNLIILAVGMFLPKPKLTYKVTAATNHRIVSFNLVKWFWRCPYRLYLKRR